MEIRTYWPKNLLNVEKNIDSHQEFHLDRWFWNKGDLINSISEKKIMYLHFINWKKTILENQITYDDKINSFFISYNKIHFEEHIFIEIFINKIKNIFFGYWVKEKRRIIFNKICSFYKKISYFRRLYYHE